MTDLCVPWLRSGTGATPAEGGCILQVIDWIDRNEWTDSPPCVHPVFQRLAVRANDSLDDAWRQKLLDLAPRLMGTADEEKRVSVGLAVFCARRVLHLWEAECPSDDRSRKAIESAEAWLGEPSKAAAAAANAYVVTANSAAASASGAAAADAASVASAAAAAAAYAAYAASAADAAWAADTAALIDAASTWQFLLDTLDEYDRLTGRGCVEAVDFSPAASAMATA